MHKKRAPLTWSLLFALVVSLQPALGEPKTKTACSPLLAAEATDTIARAFGATSADNFVAAHARLASERRAKEVADERLAALERLHRLGDEIPQCQRKMGCLRRVARRVHIELSALRSVIGHVFVAEPRARKELLSKTDSLANEWVDKHYEELQLLHTGVPGEGEVATLVSNELAQSLQNNHASPRNLAHRLGTQFLGAFGSILRLFPGIRHNATARRDYFRNLVTVLSLQGAAHLLCLGVDLWQGKTPNPAAMLWMYPFTAFLMLVQGDVGLKNTTLPAKPLTLDSYDSVLRALPELLHGKDGFRVETLRKALGFLALLPIEYTAGVFAKMTGWSFRFGSEVSTTKAKWVEAALVNLVCTLINSTYLITRWSLVDKRVNLKLIPALRATAQKKTQDAWRSAQEAHPELASWSLRDAVLLSQGPLRRSLFFWRRASSEARAAYEADPRRITTLLATPEVAHALSTRAAEKLPSRIDWGWRYGVILVDSIAQMRLFGAWVPRWLGYGPEEVTVQQ